MASASEPAPLLEEVLQGIRLDTVQGNHAGTKDPEEQQAVDVGALCKTKILYEGPKKCECCINWVEQYPSNIKESAEETSDAKRHAILCRVKKAHGSGKQPLELHSIVIQSPVLKRVLGDVFAGYPGITTTLEDVTFQAPFWEFFYRWDALTKASESSESDALELMTLLLDTLTTQLGSVRRVYKDLAQNNVITYDFLWTLFAPGTLVFHRRSGADCLLEVETTEYDKRSGTYNMRCRHVKWGSENPRWKMRRITIEGFSGTKAPQDLSVYPISHHSKSEIVMSSLLERGRKFARLGGWHHKAYSGIIRLSGDILFGSQKFQIDERIVVDATAFAKHVKKLRPSRYFPDKDESSALEGELSDHQLMLCSPTVAAYGLRTKCWGKVLVDGITDINWNKSAFDNLVLDNDTKKLVESFVLAQTNRTTSTTFDDIVEGKGQGLVLLLSGDPGLGKTLTAETVAERTCRPLYMVSAGELGTRSHEVEQGLTKVLDLAYRWNAVLLLDESDVFLEQRSSHNLQHNQLVSVFLRMLEYYRGLLFLTTNRPFVFDSAFQSRIHLTLHYQGFDHASRMKVWQLLLDRAQGDVDEKNLAEIAEEPLNGRQIKNAVKVAKLLATSENAQLGIEHIRIVLRVMRNERNLGSFPFSEQSGKDGSASMQ